MTRRHLRVLYRLPREENRFMAMPAARVLLASLTKPLRVFARWVTPAIARERPRPMTGFFAALTPEQQKAALSYDGPENFGQPGAPKRTKAP